MRRSTMDRTYFEALYAHDPDPWRFASSDYERTKYAATLAALPRSRYARALEIGCSIGVLTRQLASRCDALIATEPATLARDQAQERCAELSNVTILGSEAPRDWPDGTFDLIVLSEVIYYMTYEQVAVLAGRVAGSLQPGGHAVLVHWVRETDYPLSGDDAVVTFLSNSPGLTTLRQERTADYRLDVLERPGFPP